MTSPARRVVITGMGAVTPLGLSAEESWKNCLAGKSGVSRLVDFPFEECPVQIGAQVKGFDFCSPLPRPLLVKDGLEIREVGNKKDARKMARFIQFSQYAGLHAFLDSDLGKARALGKIEDDRIGVNIGVGIGGLTDIEDTRMTVHEKGIRRVSPFYIPQVIANLSSGRIAITLKLKGPNLCTVTACASSSHAIGESAEMIRRGAADVMIAGGSEAVIGPTSVGGFAAMKALSTRNHEPEKASRPFDVDRDGFVIGEGASILILEELEFAKARGAKIYAEVLGYGLSGDGYHMTSPAPEGEGGYRSMKMALQQSGLKPEQIDYVNAHGTSTPAGDAEEATAVKRLFPHAPEHLVMSSTKSMTGHLLGATGAVEAMFCVYAIRDQKVPPTINLDNLDPKSAATGIDFVAHKAQERKVNYALSNSFGFGGTNATLILGRA